MHIKINYRDGSTRVLHPTDHFLKGEPEHVRKKLEDIARSTGIPKTAVLSTSDPDYCMTLELCKPETKEKVEAPKVEVTPERIAKRKRKRLKYIKAFKKTCVSKTFTMINQGGVSRTLDEIRETRKKLRKL